MVMVMDHRVSEHAVVLMEKRAGSKDDIREGHDQRDSQSDAKPQRREPGIQRLTRRLG